MATRNEKKICMSSIFWQPKTLWLQYPPKNAPRKNKLDYCTIMRFPLTTRSVMKIHLCSLWVPRPTNTRSNRLWRSTVKKKKKRGQNLNLWKVSCVSGPSGSTLLLSERCRWEVWKKLLKEWGLEKIKQNLGIHICKQWVLVIGFSRRHFLTLRVHPE